MAIEAGKYSDKEKKDKKSVEQEEKQEVKKQNEFQKTKEKINIEIHAEEDLLDLKELVLQGVISTESAKNMVDGNALEDDIIQEIFNKIDEIEDISDIDKYLPVDLRISKQDYASALEDPIFRVQTITKLESALVILAKQISPDTISGMNLFSWFLSVLDKNLVTIQENTIDVKENLKALDEEKIIDQRNWWEKLVALFKEIFS